MTAFAKILVPVDFSFNAQQGLRYADAFAARFGGAITLAYVVEPQVLSPGKAAADELTEAGRQGLAKLAARESSNQSETGTLLLRGEAGGALTDAAAEHGADLIIMSTHGHTGLAHLLLGSTAEKVVRRARCPVLTVRPTEPGGVPSVELRKILLATDFSAGAASAFPLARTLAESSGAELVVAHVMEPPVYPTAPDFAGGPAPVDVELEAAVQKRLQDLVRAEFGSVQARAELGTGRAHLRLVELAQQEKVDLIVLATHGHTGFSHLLLGSTAERVVRHAPCPVLTVRAPQND